MGQSDRAPETKEWGGYLMYHVDEGLSVVTAEVTNLLDHVIACQGCLN